MVLIPKILFNICGKFEPSISVHEIDMWIRLTNISDVVLAPEYLAAYRRHEGQITTQKTKAILDEYDQFIGQNIKNISVSDFTAKLGELFNYQGSQYASILIDGIFIQYYFTGLELFIKLQEIWLIFKEQLHEYITEVSEKDLFIQSIKKYINAVSKEDVEYYYTAYMSGKRPYNIGDLIYFTSGHKPYEYGNHYCVEGLAFMLGYCVWSKGEYTSFVDDLPEPVNEPLSVSVGLYDTAFDWSLSSPSQTVSCEVNGVDCGSVTLTVGKKYMKFDIPAKAVSGKLRVRFRYSYLYAPPTSPVKDLRISIAFERMKISCSAKNTIEDMMFDQNIILSDENKRLFGEVADLQAQIQSIYNSRSWRIANKLIKAASRILRLKK
jgi:hypothetical protein